MKAVIRELFARLIQGPLHPAPDSAEYARLRRRLATGLVTKDRGTFTLTAKGRAFLAKYAKRDKRRPCRRGVKPQGFTADPYLWGIENPDERVPRAATDGERELCLRGQGKIVDPPDAWEDRVKARREPRRSKVVLVEWSKR